MGLFYSFTKMLGTHLTVCLVLASVQLMSPQILDVETPNNQNKTLCAPKSKRWTITKHCMLASSWFAKKFDELHECSCTIQTRREHKRRARQTKKVTTKLHSPNKPTLNLVKLMCYTTIVMSANANPLCDNTAQLDTDSGAIGVDN